MAARRETGVTRHAGGWIVLSGGLLLLCLWSAPPRVPGAANANGTLSEPSSSAGEGVSSEDRFPKLSIDINEADAAELSCIPGIGPKLAARIVEARQRCGRFTSLDQLDGIPGIGPHMAEQLKAALQPLDRQINPIKRIARQ